MIYKVYLCDRRVTTVQCNHCTFALQYQQFKKRLLGIQLTCFVYSGTLISKIVLTELLHVISWYASALFKPALQTFFNHPKVTATLK